MEGQNGFGGIARLLHSRGQAASAAKINPTNQKLHVDIGYKPESARCFQKVHVNRAIKL